MRVKNWRKIAWAIEGSHGTYSGLRQSGIFNTVVNFNWTDLGGFRSYRRCILQVWKNRRVMSRFRRQESRGRKREWDKDANEM